MNWAINIVILGLIMAGYAANRQGDYGVERRLDGLLVAIMTVTVLYGILKLRKMQEDYDSRHPEKEPKKK